MARKPTTKGTTKNMTEQNLAADLGLETEATNTAAAPASAKREAVKIGGIKRGKLQAIPSITRTGNDAESKYAEFDNLEAPGADGFDSAFVEYDDTEDEKRFSRSVQAAYTKATAAAKEAGKPNRYIGRRSADENGKLLGIYVIRVDGHNVQGDDTAE